MSAVRIVLALIRGISADRAELAAENLALRQQLAVLVEQKKRPLLRSTGVSAQLCIADRGAVTVSAGWLP